MNDLDRLIYDEKMHREPIQTKDVLAVASVSLVILAVYALSIYWMVIYDSVVKSMPYVIGEDRAVKLLGYWFVYALSFVSVVGISILILYVLMAIFTTVNPYCVRLILKRSIGIE